MSKYRTSKENMLSLAAFIFKNIHNHAKAKQAIQEYIIGKNINIAEFILYVKESAQSPKFLAEVTKENNHVKDMANIGERIIYSFEHVLRNALIGEVEDILVPVNDVAARLSISPSEIYALINKGQLEANRINKKTFIKKSALDDFIGRTIVFVQKPVPQQTQPQNLNPAPQAKPPQKPNPPKQDGAKPTPQKPQPPKQKEFNKRHEPPTPPPALSAITRTEAFPNDFSRNATPIDINKDFSKSGNKNKKQHENQEPQHTPVENKAQETKAEPAAAEKVENKPIEEPTPKEEQKEIPAAKETADVVEETKTESAPVEEPAAVQEPQKETEAPVETKNTGTESANESPSTDKKAPEQEEEAEETKEVEQPAAEAPAQPEEKSQAEREREILVDVAQSIKSRQETDEAPQKEEPEKKEPAEEDQSSIADFMKQFL